MLAIREFIKQSLPKTFSVFAAFFSLSLVKPIVSCTLREQKLIYRISVFDILLNEIKQRTSDGVIEIVMDLILDQSDAVADKR